MTTGFTPDPTPSPAQAPPPPGFKPDGAQQQQQIPQGFKPDNAPQPAAQQNQDPSGFRKYLTSGGIYSQNPSVNVMQDFATNYGGVPMKGGITPAFRSIVTQLTNQGNKLGVYDFNAGHTSLGAASPHAQGRAADFDTINGEPVGTHLSPNLGTFINQALQTDPRVRIGVPKEIFTQLGGLTGNGRIFVDDPAHIHIELDPMAAAPGKAPAVQQFKPDQPKLGKPQEAGFAQAIKNAAGAIEETGKGFFKEGVYEMGHPMELYTDIEGGVLGQRGILGALSVLDPSGKGEFLHDVASQPQKIVPAIGQAIYDTFHPHSPEVQERGTSTAINNLFAPLNIKQANKNSWGYFGQAIAAQSAFDPATYIPVLGGVLRGAAEAGDVMKIASVLDDVPAVKSILNVKQSQIGQTVNKIVTGIGKAFEKDWGIRPENREYLEPHAFDARTMIEHSGSKEIEPLRQADEQMLSKHEGELRNVQEGELPEPVRQRYLQEPYVYGTPEMREQALQMGYHPQPGEAERPPLSALVYNLRNDYQTLIKPRAGGETEQQAFERISGGSAEPREYAPFEKERKGDAPLGNDQYDITENRLRLGRNLIRRRIVDQRTTEYLKKYGGAKPGLTDIRQLSSRPWSIETGYGTYMRKLATESIKGMVFPHAIGNVGPLNWLKGGWTATGLALKHAVTGLSDEQVARQKALGLWAEYLGKDMNSPWRKPPLSYAGGKAVDKWIDVSTQILNRLEGGFRQGLLDLADHQHGYDPSNLKNEYKKAKDVLDALGDYGNVNKVVASLSGKMGAPFAAFGLSIVPKALWKAIKEHPDRVAGYSRATQDLQNDRGGPLPAGQSLGGGPVEKFARQVTNPESYALSPAVLGPVGYPATILDRMAHHEPVDPAQVGGELVQSYGGPVGNVASEAFGLAFPGPGQKRGEFALRDALLDWMTGRYLKKEPSAKGQAFYNRVEEEGDYPKRIHHHHFSQ